MCAGRPASLMQVFTGRLAVQALRDPGHYGPASSADPGRAGEPGPALLAGAGYDVQGVQAAAERCTGCPRGTGAGVCSNTRLTLQPLSSRTQLLRRCRPSSRQSPLHQELNCRCWPARLDPHRQCDSGFRLFTEAGPCERCSREMGRLSVAMWQLCSAQLVLRGRRTGRGRHCNRCLWRARPDHSLGGCHHRHQHLPLLGMVSS